MTPIRTKKGFTLIELLVVISIIALLLAIIGPSLKKAKEAGMRIMCLSNLRGLTQAVHLYNLDNDGDFPSGHTKTNSSWVDARGLRELNLNLWDLTAGSEIGKVFHPIRQQMIPDD